MVRIGKLSSSALFLALTFNLGTALASAGFIQKDGKILVHVNPYPDYAKVYKHVGSYTVRLTTDGTIDNSFGDQGLLAVKSGRQGWAFPLITPILSGDGTRFLMTGPDYLTAFLTDGTPDSTFGTGGVVQLATVPGVVFPDTALFQADKILVNEFFREDGERGKVISRLRRLSPQGSPDLSFAGGNDGLRGKVAVTVLKDEKIIAFEVNRIVRLKADGSLDTDFHGPVRRSFGTWAVEASDGHLFVPCDSPTQRLNLCVQRLDRGGEQDKTYGDNGLAYLPFDADDWSQDAAVDGEGRAIVLGNRQLLGQANTSEIVLVRFTTEGKLDLSFGNQGSVVIPESGTDLYVGYHLGLTAEGKLVVFGDSGEQLSGGYALRLDSNGQPDKTFGQNGVALIPLQQL